MREKYIVRDASTQEHFTVGDECSLAEVLHPKNEELPIKNYSLSHAELLPHGKTLPHKLMTSTEVYWIIGGRGTLYLEGEPVELKKGRTVLIPPSTLQYVVNDNDEKLEFICIVSPPWSSSDEEIC